MFSTIRDWLKVVKLPVKGLITFAGLIIIEIICYIFTPISFANIVDSVSNQNINLAILWASINFLVQILSTLANSFKVSYMTKAHADILERLNNKKTKNNENLISKSIEDISNYIYPLNSFCVFCFKLFSIIIVASIYSLYLMAYIIIAITICLIVSNLYTIKSSTKNILVDVLWSIFTLIITLVVINLISNQKITLKVFLLFSTFINTHLLKPNFDVGFISETKSLKAEIETFTKFSNL